jgi:hypothetical protein
MIVRPNSSGVFGERHSQADYIHAPYRHGYGARPAQAEDPARGARIERAAFLRRDTRGDDAWDDGAWLMATVARCYMHAAAQGAIDEQPSTPFFLLGSGSCCCRHT